MKELRFNKKHGKMQKKDRLGNAMVFIGLAVGLILVIAGILGLMGSEAGSEFAISSMLLIAGIAVIVYVVYYYRKRNRKKKGENDDCCDFSFGHLDCLARGHSGRNKDGTFDCDSADCDCTPGCGN